jgi:pantoate--beta-alanine ligase
VKVVDRIAGVRTALAPARAAGRVVGFVPTMGALHEGHLSLVRAARARSDVVVVSIFVNPLQFGRNEDLDAYPRDEEGDLRLLEAEKVDLVFLPARREMYRRGRSTRVRVSRVTEVLEGEHRPGHFEGVATAVAKLFNIVAPDVAFFGQKDAQQVAVIRRMVRDLDFDLEIAVCPIVREPDGLAMSSRNAYLSADQRRDASVLHRALRKGADAFRTAGSPAEAEEAMGRELASAPQVEVDYAVACDPDDFGRPRSGRPVLLAVAARLGTTRLIDNILLNDEEY